VSRPLPRVHPGTRPFTARTILPIGLGAIGLRDKITSNDSSPNVRRWVGVNRIYRWEGLAGSSPAALGRLARGDRREH
jgi:hypothetical protein